MDPLPTASVQQSPYLVRALQQGAQQQPAQPQFQTPSADQLAKFFSDSKAWETANPGQSYVAHNLGQAGRNLMNAPANAWAGLQGGAQTIASIPGQLSGLFSLGRAASGN